MGIFVNQVGYFVQAKKVARINFKVEKFDLRDDRGVSVYYGNVTHFGTDDISGDDIYLADFSLVRIPGRYRIYAGLEKSYEFVIADNPYEDIFKSSLKAYYFLRCGEELQEKYAGKFKRGKCHCKDAVVYKNEAVKKTVVGGWHDAGDYGRYVTAGAVAASQLMYAYRFFEDEMKLDLDIPSCDRGRIPDILSEVKVELDWLLKMQREDGAVYHKETTMNHARFIMPEEDDSQMYLFPVSSIATADFAGTMALGYLVYSKYDSEYAGILLDGAVEAYQWLAANEEPLLFENPKECTTGDYSEDEDFSNRFYAACVMLEVFGAERYFIDCKKWYKKLHEYFENRNSSFGEYVVSANVDTELGYGCVSGLGALSLFMYQDNTEMPREQKEFINNIRLSFENEAQRLKALMDTNGYAASMLPSEYVWGSNMVMLKHGMVLAMADYKSGTYLEEILEHINGLLGSNALGFSYVTGYGDNSCLNPHLRPTACDGIDEIIKGFVSGGPNRNLQDPWAEKNIPRNTPPMKCYSDEVEAYSLNEITIYWNSPLVFLFGAVISFMKMKYRKFKKVKKIN